MIRSIFIFLILSFIYVFAQTDIPNISSSKSDSGQVFYSDKPTLDSKDKFQFVIVSDRTGGMRKGVFEDAIHKINLLQPEFVISVGDLIDGYTEDSDVITAQWHEFLGMIDQLQMRFYFLPGNHDISNDILAVKWKQLFGNSYYHFIYKDVLFLCLNTEDPPGKGISTEQIRYFEEVLQKNKNISWTMVFMHKPLWAYGDKQGYDKISSILKNRNYTVFSGHHHQYRKSKRDSSTFYTLATTGGGSALRGIDLGEFDHIAWVTMTDKGPVVANLLLSGIVDDAPVNDNTHPMVQTLLDGNWFKLNPYVHQDKQFDEISTEIMFENPTDDVLIVSGSLASAEALTYKPDSISLEIQPKSSLKTALKIEAKPPADISRIESPIITLTGNYRVADGKTISIDTQKKLLIDWQHTCSQIADITIDGNSADWPEQYFLVCTTPQYIKENWDWNGITDGYFRFATGYDPQYIYLTAEAHDNNTIISNEDGNLRQDKFILTIKPGYADHKKELAQVDLVLSPAGYTSTVEDLVTEYEFHRTENKICAEIKLSRKILGPDVGNFRLNIAWMDHDNPANIKPSVLWWRPPWNSSLSYEGSGVFTLR